MFSCKQRTTMWYYVHFWSVFFFSLSLCLSGGFVCVSVIMFPVVTFCTHSDFLAFWAALQPNSVVDVFCDRVCVCLSECTCGQNLWTIMTIVSQQLTKALYQVSSLRCSEHEHSANTLTMPDVLMLYPEFRLKTSKTEKWSVIEYSLALSIPLHTGCVCVDSTLSPLLFINATI